VVLILGILWGPGHAWAQDTETQQLSLEQGLNFVSLRVQPEDASLGTIFQGHLDQIHRVRDERGRVYMPGNGIEQLTTWDPDESYKVYTTDAFDMEVTGTPLSLTTAAVPLEKGGNMIPFLPADPQAVDEGLMSISETLLRVENEEKNVYEPGEASSSLDSLRAGQGYVLYVDQPDTLTYTIQTATLMEALSLKGLQEEQYIRAGGRNKADDGGGGMFVVTRSARKTDGATVFIFDEDLTSESYTFDPEDEGLPWELEDVPDTDLSWRSFEVRYGPDQEDVVGIKHLHGHFLRAWGLTPTVNLKTGAVTDGGANNGRLTRLKRNWGYGKNNGTFTYNYSHATSSRRLERKNVSNSVKPEWWGAPKADPNDPVEIDPYLRWSATKAQELRDQNNLSEVYIDLEGIYYYLHATKLPSSVKPRGVGPLDLDSGMPTKFQDDYTRTILRGMPGEALYHHKSDYDAETDPDRTRAHEGLSAKRFRPFRNLFDAEDLAYEKIMFDGNVRNNMQVFNNLGDYDNPIEQLADGGSWVAWNTVAIGGKRWKDGMTFTLDNINIVDMGGAGISHTSIPDDLRMNYETRGEVRVYHARRNHTLYGLTGNNISGATLQGQFHGGMLTLDGRATGPQNYSDFTLKNIEAGQFSYNTIIGIRGGPLAQKATLDNFTIDLSNADASTGQTKIIRNDRPGTTAKNFDIEGPESFNSNLVLIVPHGSDDQELYKNINYVDNGKAVDLGLEGRNTVYENITVETADGVNEDTNVKPIDFFMAGGSRGVPRQHRTVIKNLEYERSYSNLFGAIHDFNYNSTPHPKDLFFIGGFINNNAGQLIHKFGEENTVGRIYMNNFTINMLDIDDYHGPLSPDGAKRKYQGGPKVVQTHFKMRNAMGDFGGGDIRPSDSSGTFTTDQSHEGQDFVDIDPNLLSHPWERSATVTGGNRSVTGVDVVDQNNNIVNDPSWDQRDGLKKHDIRVQLDGTIQAGNTVTIDWTARVTPLESYTTTGLFVARRIDDQSYTSGNGPFTMDLRGTAGTQESWDPIIYTASSDDPSVVTAGVQPDDYTLELTEQGTGTATITVTGEILGIGTTTISFDVTLN